MLDQLDMFAMPAIAPPPPAAVDPDELVYSAVPKPDGRWAINWRCGTATGVVGGWYFSEAEALSCIEFRRELRAQGVRDPRPWMRIPPEGAHP